MLEKLNKLADPAAHEAISSLDSLEEDIGLVLYDEEPQSEREVTKKVKGARYLLQNGKIGNRNLLEKLEKEADPAAYEGISSVDSLEEDIGLALVDKEPESHREVTKKVKGARFLTECINKFMESLPSIIEKIPPIVEKIPSIMEKIPSIMENLIGNMEM